MTAAYAHPSVRADIMATGKKTQGCDTHAEVYVQLLNEGVDVFRPVPAKYVDGVVFVLEATSDYDEEIETWEFPPGSRVICVKTRLGEGECMVAKWPAPTTDDWESV